MSYDAVEMTAQLRNQNPEAVTKKFTGHEGDGGDNPGTKYDLDYMHARYYSAWQSRFLSVDPAPGDPRQPQSWNRYSYVLGNPLKYKDPFGEDVSIRLTFQGDDWSDDDKATVIAYVTAFWERLDVGAVHVFDSASSNETNSPLFNAGVTSPTVDSAQSGQSHPGIVKAGEFLNSDKVSSRAEALNGVANAINHEVFVHQFKLSLYDNLDSLTFNRQSAGPRLEPAIHERYGTVADAWAWADPRIRAAFISGPIPLHPEDRREAHSRLGSKRLSPPSPGTNKWWKLW